MPMPPLLEPALFWSPEAPPQAFVRTDIPDDRRRALAMILAHGDVHKRYRGLAVCRICQQWLGSADMTAHGMIYPQRAEHYIIEHDVSLGYVIITQELR